MRVEAKRKPSHKASRDRQRAVYEVLRTELAQPGSYAPSLRDIAQQLGFSVSSVDAAIRELALAGFVSRQPRQARSLRLTHKKMSRPVRADVCKTRKKI